MVETLRDKYGEKPTDEINVGRGVTIEVFRDIIGGFSVVMTDADGMAFVIAVGVVPGRKA